MSDVRVGSGVDVHAFDDDPGRPLVLGGVTIPDTRGLAGHSDADVVAHALTDALLGAVGLGDLGSVFGVDDPALAGADSLALLERAVERVEAAGWTTVNVDLTVVAQHPRLAPHLPGIRRRLSDALGLPVDSVSVKATSTDGLGSIGRGDGIGCWALTLVSRPAGA